MSVGSFALALESGTTFSLVLTWENPDGTPVDLTGYSARMHVVDNLSNKAPLLSFDSVSGGGTGTSLVVGTTDGTLAIGLTATASAAQPWTEGVYSILVRSPSGTITPLLEGPILLNPGIGW